MGRKKKKTNSKQKEERTNSSKHLKCITMIGDIFDGNPITIVIDDL